jgi:hypothetical protein
MVDHAVAAVRGRIDGIELHGDAAGIDEIVLRPARDDHRRALANGRLDTIKDHLARALLHAKELVRLVGFHPYVFPGLQRHEDQLRLLGRVEDLAKISVLDGNAFDSSSNRGLCAGA